MEEIITKVAVVLGTILISMTLHEAMHGYMAYLLGDDTAKLQGRLTLNPIKHIDPIMTIALPLLMAVMGGPIFGGAKPVPFNPIRIRGGEWGAAAVAIAGPLTNFVLAFVFFGLFMAFHGNSTLSFIFSTATMVNLGFFVFNILPIPPLDGSRVVYALAPEFVRRGMEWVEQYGIFIVLILVVMVGDLLSAYMTGAIGFFVQLFSLVFR